VHRFGIFSVVVCVIATAFWTFPATAEEGLGTHGEIAEKHAGGDHDDFENDLAPAAEVNIVDSHEVWVYGVNFEAML